MAWTPNLPRFARRAGIHGGDGLDGHAKLVEALSAALDCDKDKITHKVQELFRVQGDIFSCFRSMQTLRFRVVSAKLSMSFIICSDGLSCVWPGCQNVVMLETKRAYSVVQY